MIQCSWITPSVYDPEKAIVLVNHLGSSLKNDFHIKAEEIAKLSHTRVLAYERPGTGSQTTFNLGLRHELQPKRYLQTAWDTGRQLQKVVAAEGVTKVVLAGNSGGAVDVAMIARSETLRIHSLALGDPASIKQTNLPAFAFRWLQQQRHENQLPDDGPPDPNAISDKEMIRRAIPEVFAYNAMWRSTKALEALYDIATKKQFGGIAVNAAFVEHTFTAPPLEMYAIADGLQQHVPAGRAAPFQAHVMPDTDHSYFNSSQHYVDFINDTLRLDRAA
jgi:pimeloyl-ACP methyl ester carboxylesterase